MSDPFADIDTEVNIDKFKNFFKKYKLFLILISLLLIIAIISISIYRNHINNKKAQMANYYIEILSILEKDPERAKTELQKLSKLNDRSYKNLSNLLISKIQFEANEYENSLATLKKVENNLNSIRSESG